MKDFRTITEYANDIMAHKNSPAYLNDIHLELCAKYAMLSDIAKDCQIEKAEFTTNTKFGGGDKPLSDNSVEAKWLITEGGKKEIKLKYELKALEKMMSAIKSSVVISSIETKNQF